MSDSFIRKSEIEKLLNTHWSTFVDGPKIMKRALVDARNSRYTNVIPADQSVSSKTGVTISKFTITNKGFIELWVEFSVLRSEGVVVGTHVYSCNLSGDAELVSTYGTIFQLETEIN